jgi:threonine dehydrogenase-like Zn-dependent dehydrogenase
LRGLYYDRERSPAPIVREDLPVPEIRPGEARVRVSLAGVCRTDLEILRGYVPFTGVLGHEFVGVVDRADGRDDLVGARVVGEINAVCGACDACRAGRGRHCPSRTVLGIAGRDGCMAEYLVLPVVNLHRLSDSVGDEAAVFVEPLAAAYRIVEQLPLTGRERTLVMGDGKLGLLVAMVLSHHVGELVLSGRHGPKLAIAEAAGIATVRADRHEPRGYDLVVECTGRPTGLAEALAAVRPMGTVVLKSTVVGETCASLSAGVVDEVTIVGSRCGPFEPAIEALAARRIDPRPLVSARFALVDGTRALEHAAEAGVLKVLVDCR